MSAKVSADKSTTVTASAAFAAEKKPFFSQINTGQFFSPSQRIQTKLTVNKAGDAYEQEADRTAERVMRIADPAPKNATVIDGENTRDTSKSPAKIQRASFFSAIPSIQRASTTEAPSVSPRIQSAIHQKVAGGGSPLNEQARDFMEPRFNADFSSIKIHHDAEAASISNHLGARAFTYQNNIFFAQNQYQPSTSEGKHLLAHELTHTIQQGRATQSGSIQRTPAVSTGAPASIQRWGVQEVLDRFANWAYNIPGFRLLTIVMGVNPINMRGESRSADNILRAMVEVMPGGHVISQALDNHGVFARAGAWIQGQLSALGNIGGDLADAIRQFINGLSWTDVFDLGGVWDRAKQLFTSPISRLINFAISAATGILQLIKQAILRPLAALAQGTAGYDLLKAILGQDPVTGDPVPRTADTLIGGFMKMIGQEEIWANIKRGNAVARAWAWFQGALSGLMGFVTSIPQRIITTITSLTIQDVITVAGAFVKIGSAFAGLVAQFTSWALNQTLMLLQIIVEVVAPGVMPYISRAASAFRTIIQNPVGFVGNLVRAGKLGFQKFASNIGNHLKTALIRWITGPLGEAGVYIPTSFSLMEIIKLVLSVLGLTWQNIRGKLVRIIPEPVLVGLEKTAGILVTLVREGPAAAWQQIRSELDELKGQLIAQVTQMVTTEIVKAAVTKLVSMLNPAGAVIQAIIAIYNTITFFIQKAQQIGAVVGAFINSIAAIAAGQVEGAAARVESTMAGLLTLVISFLAKFAGLGNVPNKLVDIVKKIRQPIDRGLDKIVTWLGNMLKKAGNFIKDKVAGALDWWKARKSFTDRSGETHNVYFNGQGSSAELMVASTPKLATAILDDIGKTPEGKKVIGDIRTKINAVNKLKLAITSLKDEAANKDRMDKINVLVGEIGALLATVDITGRQEEMSTVSIKFDRIYTGMDTEYNRQIKEQQDAITAMTIAKWLVNRTVFEKKGRIDDGTLRQQMNARNDTKAKYTAEQKKKGVPDAEIDKMWAYQQAATHSLDQAAGGDHNVFSNVGVSSVNSHLGSQWRTNVSKLSDEVKKVNPKGYKEKTMKVSLS